MEEAKGRMISKGIVATVGDMGIKMGLSRTTSEATKIPLFSLEHTGPPGWIDWKKFHSLGMCGPKEWSRQTAFLAKKTGNHSPGGFGPPVVTTPALPIEQRQDWGATPMAPGSASLVW